MRAHYLEDLKPQDDFVIKGDKAHHLINVARLTPQEEVLLLNGKGLMIWTRVEQVSKREIILRKYREKNPSAISSRDLILGIPKKEALELSLKQAVELGFRRIYLIRSAHSQIKIPDDDRLKGVLVSALEQSNAPYLPELIPTDWESVPFHTYDQVILLDSQSNSGHAKLSAGAKVNALVVGPEGGFSSEELNLLHSLSNVAAIKLPCPILRTPTAIATGAGLLMGRLLD
jgi:16S rRNA (uracil1498-N3)-methyltransferase